MCGATWCLRHSDSYAQAMACCIDDAMKPSPHTPAAMRESWVANILQVSAPACHGATHSLPSSPRDQIPEQALIPVQKQRTLATRCQFMLMTPSGHLNMISADLSRSECSECLPSSDGFQVALHGADGKLMRVRRARRAKARRPRLSRPVAASDVPAAAGTRPRSGRQQNLPLQSIVCGKRT